MSDTIIVPLNKLDADPENVRKTYDAAHVRELAASIKVEGVLQNLVVRKGSKRGRYFVTAGGGRLSALNALLEAGEIAKDYPVECLVKEAASPTAISLAENTIRRGMNPADQYVAFLKLYQEGMSIADIAARFGVSEAIVKQRLALCRVSPRLLELYRQEEMTFDQLKAFTITDDHAEQERVWDNLPSYSRHPSTIKGALAGDGVSATDKRVLFIGGLDTYEAEGGTVRRDLFDDRNSGYALDIALLESLVAQRLEAHAESVRAEGWKWVEIMAELPYGTLHSYGRRYPEDVALSDDDQAELDRLTDEYDELAELINGGAADDDAEDRLNEIDRRIDDLRGRMEAYSDDDKAVGGAIVTLSHWEPVIRVERGLVKPEDEQATDSDDGEDGNSGEESAAETEPEDDAPALVHSAALVEDLTAQKTAALRVELANNPDVALVAVVHALLLRVAYTGASSGTALQIHLVAEHLESSIKQTEQCRALAELDRLAERHGDHIPGNPADLWDWCFDRTREELLDLLAFAAAQSVNAVRKPHDYGRDAALAHADQLGRALNVDMAKWFQPTAESYFGRINRQSIEAAVAEARGAEFAGGIAAMKKAEAAAFAERQIAESGWLPEPVRISAEVESEAEDGEAEAYTFPEAAE